MLEFAQKACDHMILNWPQNETLLFLPIDDMTCKSIHGVVPFIRFSYLYCDYLALRNYKIGEVF